MKDDAVFKAASGLSGGVGGQGDICGAVLGAGLALGMVYGRKRDDIGNMDALRESGVPVAKLYKWFETEFGSATCRDIRTVFGGGTYYDFAVPWQKELADEADVFGKCSDLCGKTAARAAGMLWDAMQARK